LPENSQAPACVSTIKPIKQGPAYENPEKVLNTPHEMVQFFGEYLRNYLAQTINENKREEHKRVPKEMWARADEVIANEIATLCIKTRVGLPYFSEKPDGNVWIVKITGSTTPPEFTFEFIQILEKATKHDITLKIHDDRIEVVVNTSATYISGKVVRPEHILLADEGDDGNLINHATGDRKMDTPDYIAECDLHDVITRVRNQLPGDECQDTFDIYRQHGSKYIQFSDKFGDGMPKICQIAEFLGTTPKNIKMYREAIRIACLANGLHPQ
jgi:hypothetical protein